MISIAAARYANAKQTAMVIETEEHGAVAISEKDTPELWELACGCGVRVAEFVPIAPRPVAAPSVDATDQQAIERLEEAARQINGSAINADDLRRTQDDLKDLAGIVHEIASRPRVSEVGEVDLSPVYDELAKMRAGLGEVAASNEDRDEALREAARRVGAIENALPGIRARLDDAFDLIGSLQEQVSARPAPARGAVPIPGGLPPVPGGEASRGWIKDVLDRADDEGEPLPEAPQNGPPSETQALNINETRRLVVEDRWVKPFARYQVAVQARNGSVLARRSLAGPAERYGLSVDDLANKLIGEWQEIERDIMAEY